MHLTLDFIIRRMVEHATSAITQNVQWVWSNVLMASIGTDVQRQIKEHASLALQNRQRLILWATEALRTDVLPKNVQGTKKSALLVGTEQIAV
jgi:hypothetical protein